MDDPSQDKLQSKLAEFRSWRSGREFGDYRLVQYCGVELIGTRSLQLAEIEPSIEGLIREGFFVDWAEDRNRLYLRVWEFGGPEPAWSRVFAEEPLADIDEILRKARHDA